MMKDSYVIMRKTDEEKQISFRRKEKKLATHYIITLSKVSNMRGPLIATSLLKIRFHKWFA